MQVAERDIRVIGALMLIQIHVKIHDDCKVIFHVHVNGVFQCHNGKRLRIGVGRAVHCIIKPEQLFFLAEHHAEQPVFVTAVYLISCFFCFVHILFSSCRRRSSSSKTPAF